MPDPTAHIAQSLIPHLQGFSSFVMPVPERLRQENPSKAAKYDAVQLTLVDCPGHASLIRTIIGGAQIIDLVILVIDVVHGIQNQTAECMIIADITTNDMIIVLNKVRIRSTTPFVMPGRWVGGSGLLLAVCAGGHAASSGERRAHTATDEGHSTGESMFFRWRKCAQTLMSDKVSRGKRTRRTFGRASKIMFRYAFFRYSRTPSLPPRPSYAWRPRWAARKWRRCLRAGAPRSATPRRQRAKKAEQVRKGSRTS